MRDRYRRREAWRALGALVLAGVILGGSGDRPPGMVFTGPASAAVEGAVPSCQGARTLLMRRGTQRFPRSAAYDAVCIYGGVLEVASGATLRAGLLYVGADGAISSDGAAGRVPDPGGRCPNGRSGAPQGGGGRNTDPAGAPRRRDGPYHGRRRPGPVHPRAALRER